MYDKILIEKDRKDADRKTLFDAYLFPLSSFQLRFLSFILVWATLYFLS